VIIFAAYTSTQALQGKGATRAVMHTRKSEMSKAWIRSQDWIGHDSGSQTFSVAPPLAEVYGV